MLSPNAAEQAPNSLDPSACLPAGSDAQRAARIVIEGGLPLRGTLSVAGAKNAALPCMAAALLTDEDCFLENVPEIEDVRILGDVLASLGVEVEYLGPGRRRLNARHIRSVEAPPDLVRQMRASFLVMGPLLARFGQCSSPAPGGDVIGQRPIDVHLAGFQALGAEIACDADIYTARTRGLSGTKIFLDYPSHIGTENLLMAAAGAEGCTILINASAEPEVVCLANMLVAMGARISGAGSNTVVVEGSRHLGGGKFRVIPDRIEAGTYSIAAALTGGDVLLEDMEPSHLESLIWKLREVGALVDVNRNSLHVRGNGTLRAANVQALPYPGFATDLQAAIGVLLTQSTGRSVVHERVYDNRLLYVEELRRMGAQVEVQAQTAVVVGPTPLRGANVHALDIRSGAALILAGLVAEGRTVVQDVGHLDRGYEAIEKRFASLGARIWREGGRGALESQPGA